MEQKERGRQYYQKHRQEMLAANALRKVGLKLCKTCKVAKPFAEFPKATKYHRSACAPCWEAGLQVKCCPTCKQTLKRDAFSKCSKDASGLYWRCKKCDAASALRYQQANIEKVRASKKAYRQAHPEAARRGTKRYLAKNPGYITRWQNANRGKVRAWGLRWYRNNPKKVRQGRESFKAKRPTYYRDYYQANRERLSELSRKWASANRERRLEAGRAWRKRNPLKVRERDLRRRYRIRSTRVGPVDLQSILDRDQGICYLCSLPTSPDTLSFDHIIPLAKGGPHTEQNLAVAHLSCNKRKSVKLLQELDLPLIQIQQVLEAS